MINMRLTFFTFLPVALGASQIKLPPEAAPRATTRNGTYVGRYLPEFKQDLFLGIPFARSPRLANPIPWNETWKGTRSAEWHGSICHGLGSDEELARANVTGMSEECLNLNIIRPSPETIKNHKGKLPIVVWLYGGGFIDGFGADLNSNLSYIIQDSVALGTPIMGITLNYRVGFFGFPGGEEIGREGVTNLGLKDQRQALLWIQENIAAFNGDPRKVTVWGQSAGSQSIVHQILAYNGSATTSKLFRQGILVSCGASVGNTLTPYRPDPVRGYQAILSKANCADLACLRRIPISTLWNATRVDALSTWRPMIDDDFIASPPTLQLQAGRFPRDISILTGGTNDEGYVFANSAPNIETEEELFGMMTQALSLARNETIQKVLDLYPNSGPLPPYGLPHSATPDEDKFCQAVKAAGLPCGAQYRRLAGIMGDFVFISGRRLLTQKFAEHGMKAWSYRFDTWPTSFPLDTRRNTRPGFASHGADYSYWFAWGQGHNIYGNNPAVIEASEAHRRLREGMSRMLIAFVFGGDPNKGRVRGFPEWPRYSVDNPRNIVFNATAEPDALNVHLEKDTWRKEGMALWWTYPLELDFASPE
ncbi:lipase 4 [Cladorrhinum sp. PSN332]|nr:lipase 4 [Cladorrhinum sp. PSN332]